MTASDGEPPPPSKHRRNIVSGIGWNFAAIIGEQISTLVAFVVVARILGPADFGVVILAVALVDIMISFVRAGVSEALIRMDNVARLEIGTAFWLNMAIGCTIGMGMFVLAPVIATLLDTAQVTPFLQAMTIVFPIAAAGAVAEAMLSRRMAFAAIARRQIIGSIVGAIVAISLALSGFGGWSMILQRIAIFGTGASLSIWAAGLIPPISFSWSTAKRILHFGGGITSINLLYRLQPRVAELVIGFLAQPVAVALYRAAYRIVDLVNQLPMQPLMRVVFPALSRVASDGTRFRTLLLTFVGALSLILLPVYAGVYHFSADLFHLLFGDKWNGAVQAFDFLLIAAALRIPFALLGPATSARGAVRYAALFSVLDVGLSILLMLATASFGIDAIAASRIAGALLLAPVAYKLMVQPLGIGVFDMLKTFVPAVATAAVILAGLLVADLAAAEFGQRIGLGLGIPLCALLFAIGVFCFASREIVMVAESLDNALFRKFLRTARKYRMLPR